jgi:hypothetical protein
MEQGDLMEAARHFEHGLAMVRALGNRADEGVRLSNLGSLSARLGSYARVFRDTDADYAIYERLIRARIEASGIPPQYATIRKGQAFIWAANLVHGGSSQHDRARTRASQVTHYFFEGTRYYTPLLRRAIRTCWRNPKWIG